MRGNSLRKDLRLLPAKRALVLKCIDTVKAPCGLYLKNIPRVCLTCTYVCIHDFVCSKTLGTTE